MMRALTLQDSLVHGCRWSTLLVIAAVSAVPLRAQNGAEHPVIRLALPTLNDNLFTGDGPAFYMGVNRQPRPGEAPAWTGGRYGFVRTYRNTREGPVYSRFHEGMDVRPLHRDARGVPLDEVLSIDDGEVVHVSKVSHYSNYGKYVVIEHLWGGYPYYSLYAHLGSLDVEVGDIVRRGDPIAILGYTGRGINRQRAHVHVEINLLVNQAFQAYYDEVMPNNVANRHGIYNGLNLYGIDIAGLYLALKENPGLTMPEFFALQEPMFEVTWPGEVMPNMLWRYPWMCPALGSWRPMFGPPHELGTAWRITFAASGLPLRFEPVDEVLESPRVRLFETRQIPYTYLTNGLISGSGTNYQLSAAGLRRMNLIMRSRPDY